MVLLAVLSVASGWVGIPEGFGLPIRDYFASFVAPSEFAVGQLQIEEHAFSFAFAAVSMLVGGVGIALAYLLYAQKPERSAALARRFSGLHTFLDRGWYFDALYGATVVRAALWLGRFTSAFDRRIPVGGLTRGVGRGVSWTGDLLRRLQTGGVQNYVLFILVGVLALGIIVGAQYAFLVVALIALITATAFAVGARL